MPKRIAVVNEDTAYLRMMETFLQLEGYETFAWREGSTAYEVIKREQPDLVILDIRLEHPDAGWVVLDLLRLDPETADLPVIVASGDLRFLREKEERLRAQRCQVLPEPFSLEELLSKIQEVIGPPERPPGAK